MGWLLIGLGWAIVLGAGAFACWALFGDRSRGRRRCRRCWYDLSQCGPPPVTCPECGRVMNSERAMRRTRRRGGRAALWLLGIVVGLAVALTPAYRSGRVMRYAPSWLLAELVPLWPPFPALGGRPRNHRAYELSNRLLSTTDLDPSTRQMYGARRISNPQIAAVIRRMAEGNLIAPAGSQRWIESSGNWLSGQMFRFLPAGYSGPLQYPDGTPADEALGAAFAKAAQSSDHAEPADD